MNVLGYACRCVAGRVVGASAEIVAGSAVVVRRAEDERERVHDEKEEGAMCQRVMEGRQGS